MRGGGGGGGGEREIRRRVIYPGMPVENQKPSAENASFTALSLSNELRPLLVAVDRIFIYPLNPAVPLAFCAHSTRLYVSARFQSNKSGLLSPVSLGVARREIRGVVSEKLLTNGTDLLRAGRFLKRNMWVRSAGILPAS